MQRIFPGKVKLILISLLIGIAASLPATAQTVSADASLATRPVNIGATLSPKLNSNALDECEQRLLKTLDALEKSEALLSFKDQEIEAHKRLAAVNNELLKIKDLIIAEQYKLINVLTHKKNSLWAKVKKLLALAEKIALVAAGVYLGR